MSNIKEKYDENPIDLCTGFFWNGTNWDIYRIVNIPEDTVAIGDVPQREITRSWKVPIDFEECVQSFDEYLKENDYIPHNDSENMGLRGSIFEGRVMFDWIKYQSDGKEDVWVRIDEKLRIITTTIVPEQIKVGYTTVTKAISEMIVRSQE